MKDVVFRNMTRFIITAALVLAFGLGLPTTGSAAYLVDAVPFAHLTLDESGSPYVDATTNGHDGTCTACPSEDPSTKQVGVAQDFSGDVLIEINDADAFDFGSGTTPNSFSISAWVRRDSGGTPYGEEEIVVGRTAGTMKWWLGINTVALPTFYLQSTNGEYLTIAGVLPINDGEWHQLTAVRDGVNNFNLLYVDGILVAKDSQTYTGDFGAAASIFIGTWDDTPHYPLEGHIDEVAFYNSALSAEAIKQTYNNGSQAVDLGAASNPSIVSDAVVSAYPGGYYYDVDAAGNPAPTYSLSGAPADMSIDTATGEITWIPTTVDTTPVIFTVTATNAGGSDSQQVTLDIDDTCSTSFITHLPLDETSGTAFADTSGSGLDATCANCPTPETTDVVLGAASQQFVDGSSDEISIAANTAFDFGIADDFTISVWIKRDVSASVSGDEVVIGRRDAGSNTSWHLSLEPTLSRAGFYLKDSAVERSIYGGVNLNDDAWHQLTVVRDGSNHINYLYVDGAFVTSASVDYTGDGFSATTAVYIGSWGGGLYFPGWIDDVAFYSAALSAAQVKQSYTDTMAGRTGCNQAPTITTTAVTSGSAGALYTYDADATDPDAGDTLTWSLTNAPSGMTVDDATGVVSWTPAGNVSSSGEVTLTVEDGFGGADEQKFTIAVAGSSNSAPVITTTAPTSVAVGGTFTYDADADDADSDTLTWSLTNAPTGMTVVAATGEVTWTPASDVTTSGAVTLTVSDGHGGTDTETFTVTVGSSGGGGGGGGGGCFIDSSRASLVSGFHGNVTLDNPVVMIILLVLAPFILILARKSRFDAR